MNDDYLSRQAAIICEDVISRIDTINRLRENSDFICSGDKVRAVETVVDMPSVTPKAEPCEDAISRAEVHNLLATWISDYLTDETREALETIDYKIEDLPPVTPKAETCGNAISRQAALDEAFEVDTKEYGRIDVIGVDAIDALPPVTLKQRTGHWERGYSYPDGEYWKCSHCNEIIKVKIPMHYCNNCGAKMEEPQERSDKE